jgi:outer membrane protein TolC
MYNESRTVIAQIDTEVAHQELRDKLEKHSLEVARAYWDVYRARAIHRQKQNLLTSASSILDMLVAREAVDAVRRQVLRADAAVASRRSEIMRAEATVRNAESRLRLLVNDPKLVNGGRVELIPVEMPAACYVDISMRDSLETALCCRPDIASAVREIRTASVRLGVAKTELLPTLDLVVSTYLAGLEGDARIGTAFGNQFADGEPGYSLGLLFEIPLGNRTARAEFESRHAELRKAMFELQSTVATGLTEVEVAVREVETSYHEMIGKYQAMIAAEAESSYLDRRWRLVPGYDAATPYLLEDLLDAQERLADEEAGFVTAQVNYTLALIELKRATGTLMRSIDGGGYQQGWPASDATVANRPAQGWMRGRY